MHKACLFRLHFSVMLDRDDFHYRKRKMNGARTGDVELERGSAGEKRKQVDRHEVSVRGGRVAFSTLRICGNSFNKWPNLRALSRGGGGAAMVFTC